MLYHGCGSAGILNREQVEAVLVSRTSVAEPPHSGHPGNVSLLSPADCLQSGPADAGATGLHLDERHRVPPANDEVDVMAAQPESVGFHHPSARGEVGDGGALTLEAKDMASVFPFRGGNESAAAAHAQRYTIRSAHHHREDAGGSRKLRYRHHGR